MSETVRIQFDIEKEKYDKLLAPYIRKYSLRHDKAHDAFLEWAARKAGRDKKHRKEEIISDAALLADAVTLILEDKGLI